MLDDLDRELWERGHRFVRYADDVRVFVRSKRAARRVLDSVTGVVEDRLKLRVNREKSSVQSASTATLLGFGFYFSRSGVRIRTDPKVLRRFKDRVRELTSRRWSVSMPCRIDRLNAFIRGWMAYFRVAESPVLKRALPNTLGRPWPAGATSNLAQAHHRGLTNRRMRARMSGGVGGGSGNPTGLPDFL